MLRKKQEETLAEKRRIRDLKIQLNINREKAINERGRAEQFNLPDNIPEIKSVDEEIKDQSRLRNRAIENLKRLKLRSVDLANIAEKLQQDGDLILFNRFFNLFQNDIKQADLVNPEFFDAVWGKFKEKLAKTGDTGIFEQPNNEELMQKLDELRGMQMIPALENDGVPPPSGSHSRSQPAGTFKETKEIKEAIDQYAEGVAKSITELMNNYLNLPADVKNMTYLANQFIQTYSATRSGYRPHLDGVITVDESGKDTGRMVYDTKAEVFKTLKKTGQIGKTEITPGGLTYTIAYHTFQVPLSSKIDYGTRAGPGVNMTLKKKIGNELKRLITTGKMQYFETFKDANMKNSTFYLSFEKFLKSMPPPPPPPPAPPAPGNGKKEKVLRPSIAPSDLLSGMSRLKKASASESVKPEPTDLKDTHLNALTQAVMRRRTSGKTASEVAADENRRKLEREAKLADDERKNADPLMNELRAKLAAKNSGKGISMNRKKVIGGYGIPLETYGPDGLVDVEIPKRETNMGVEPNIGRYYLSLAALRQGELRLRDKNGKNLLNGPFKKKLPVSSDLKKILFDIVIHKRFSEEDYEALDDIERKLFDDLVLYVNSIRPNKGNDDNDNSNSLGKLLYNHKTYLDNERDATLKRFNILRGIVIAGNDNPEVLKELKGLLLKMREKKFIDGHLFNSAMRDLFYLTA